MKRIKQTTINILIIAILSTLMVSCGVFNSKKKVCIPCRSSSFQVYSIDENSVLKS